MNIVVANGQPFMLNGIVNFIQQKGHKVVGACDNGIVALNLIMMNIPDVAVLDAHLDGLTGIDILHRTYSQMLPTRIVIISGSRSRTLYLKAQNYSVFGYILKEHPIEELGYCLDMAFQKRIYNNQYLEKDLKDVDTYDEIQHNLDLLLPIERSVLQLISKQKTSKQIAESLFMSEKTIEGYRSRIIEKLGIPKEKNALLIWAMRMSVFFE